ncbi:MAG: hypothetical protein JWL64_633 [Frankiales bacterium]|nr:hypothetical protein [Frankiales bacterium]
MGVYLTDRLTGAVLGLSNRLWGLLGESLTALGAHDVGFVFTRDGYTPSYVAQAWGGLLFEGLGDLVVICRPVPGQPGTLRPVTIVRAGTPAAADWARRGEALSPYDLPLATVFLHYATWTTGSSGYVSTTLRPVSPGNVLSPVAARTLQARSGLGLGSEKRTG